MRIAIIKLSSLGDIAFAMLALQFIKTNSNHVEIDWIIDDQFSQVMHKHPDINRVISLRLREAKRTKSISLFLKELLKLRNLKKYDKVIDAQGLLKSAIVASFVKAESRIGFCKNSIREKIASFIYDQHVSIGYEKNSITRNLKVILDPLGISFNRNEILNRSPYLFSNSKMTLPKEKYFVIIIGGTWKSRIYPKENILKFLKMFENEKFFIVWHTAEEKRMATWLEKNALNASKSKKMSIQQLILFIKGAAGLVGNDTGPTHIAWSLNIPSITIFGPTPTTRTFKTKKNITISSNTKIDPFKFKKDDFSIQSIPPSKIADKFVKLMGSNK